MRRMSKESSENAREKLLAAGTELFRRRGFVPTKVDEICLAAGVTKGAFFHYFDSKELLAEACLRRWEERVAGLYATASFQSISDPRTRLFAAIDFFTAAFSDPNMVKSCLAGTTAQEVSETNPLLRDAAQACFARGQAEFQKLLDAACTDAGLKPDTTSLAQMWMATLQGSILLAKASREDSVIAANLRHFREYIETLFVK
jgi:TetR/AcrR family transcriptional regulator, transcriptional repressor for nem operon